MNNKYLGCGEFASCYLQGNNRVIKIYKDVKSSSMIDSKMLGLKNDTYIFPIDAIYDNGNIVATIMTYINSLPLDKRNIELEKLIDGILKAYEDTDLLSENKIKTYDVYPKNMLFNLGYKVIDTDFYTFTRDKNLIERNIFNFNTGIYILLFGNREKYKPYKFIESNRDLLDLFYQTFFLNRENKTLPEFLVLLKKVMENNIEHELITLEDLKHELKRMR